MAGEPLALTRSLVWMDRTGKETPVPSAPVRAYVYARLSPDGTRVALDIRDQQNDVWTFDLARGNLSRLTIDPGLNRGVAWSPDGRRIAFSAVRDGKENVYWQAADGSGAPERLTAGDVTQVPSGFSPDGRYLVFQEPGTAPFNQLMVDVTSPPDQRRIVKLLDSAFNEGNSEVSPDGRWIAYESNESGERSEIFVRPFPDVNAGGRWQVSNAGGNRPVWSRDGGELFYHESAPAAKPGNPRIMSVPVRSRTTFEHGAAVVAVANVPAPTGFQGRHYDVSPDGKRFLLLKPTETDQQPPELVVVLNWAEELKKLAPATK
jgi:WD40 repeat protein